MVYNYENLAIEYNLIHTLDALEYRAHVLFLRKLKILCVPYGLKNMVYFYYFLAHLVLILTLQSLFVRSLFKQGLN